MNRDLSPNTQAILLLTAPLIVGKREGGAELLSLGDYNRLARKLREAKLQPANLIENSADAEAALGLAREWFGRERIETLLGRGFLLSQALERWTSRAIWVLSRADPAYPRRLKAKLKEDAPPLLYGCGDASLLDMGGLAIVGSRHVDDGLLAYTENTGSLAARAGLGVVSGGAKGIDRAAMAGGLNAGGVVVGVLADSLERAAIARESREALMDRRLILISPYDPAAGFNVGHAMQRNKLIYALADAALVVSSDLEKGGTWAGAVEQLDRFHFGPVFVRNGTDAPAGNLALLRRGAVRWPDPADAASLSLFLEEAFAHQNKVPKQDALSLREEQADHRANTAAESAKITNLPPSPEEANEQASSEPKIDGPAPGVALFSFAQGLLLRELADGLTEAEVAARLAINQAQAKEWLSRLCESGAISKVKTGKPPRYRTTSSTGLLL
jgi:predicted Rossmann fold nucleotide-binding protein DprA/Smf involved in DNA uptake